MDLRLLLRWEDCLPLSSVLFFKRSLIPESFRGGCSFGGLFKSRLPREKYSLESIIELVDPSCDETYANAQKSQRPPEDETPDSEAETTHLPANEDDDTFSPAHDAESIGTGVADDEGVEAEEAEEADDDLVPDDTYIVENKKDTNP